MVHKINTKNYEQTIQQVLIDDREQSRKDYAMSNYSSLNPSIEHLEIGDYIFIGTNNIKVVFEYKTGSDFLNSITENNHLHNQTYEMITNFDYTFIIIETESLKRELDTLYYSTGREISLQQINGAITEYNTVSTVLFAQTQYQAFDMMMRQAGKIIQQKPFKYKFGKKKNNQALNWLSSMKGLEKTADKIISTLNIHTLEELLNVTKEDLMSVDKVGEKTAEKILQNIRSDYE